MECNWFVICDLFWCGSINGWFRDAVVILKQSFCSSPIGFFQGFSRWEAEENCCWPIFCCNPGFPLFMMLWNFISLLNTRRRDGLDSIMFMNCLIWLVSFILCVEKCSLGEEGCKTICNGCLPVPEFRCAFGTSEQCASGGFQRPSTPIPDCFIWPDRGWFQW